MLVRGLFERIHYVNAGELPCGFCHACMRAICYAVVGAPVQKHHRHRHHAAHMCLRAHERHERNCAFVVALARKTCCCFFAATRSYFVRVVLSYVLCMYVLLFLFRVLRLRSYRFTARMPARRRTQNPPLCSCVLCYIRDI